MKYPTIHIEGAILSGDILDRLADGDLRGQKPTDFALEGTVKDEIARAWADVQDTWRIYQRRLERLKETDRGTTETRNQWIVPLLGMLGYKLEFHQRGDVVDGRTYAISHRDKSRGDFRVHIMGYRDSLDRKREDSGPRMSPHALVQEYLNLTEHLYAIVTNGRQLRLLRDSTRLVKLSYIEFDLEQMVEEGHFADFAVLFRILHATRMPVSPADAAESLIEQYHQDALDSGSRIRDGLSKAVERSIIAFANGFLRHPDNEALRGAIRDNQLDARTYYQYQLRLIYRLLFLMVIEERNLVYPDGSDRTKRDIYDQYYSVSNLRRLAGKRHLSDSRHKDYWMALKNTFRLFEQEKYGAPLGIKPLAGDLFSADAIRHLNICSLDNNVLITCLSNLSVFEHPETHQRIRVNYSALNVEEFGSVYEGLLEYDAQISQSHGKFTFAFIKGSDRASSGSHYTPDELVTPLIRNSLYHVIKRKLEKVEKSSKSQSVRSVSSVVEQKEKALLSITVCDVACGSGHILLNAARRIATELAIVRTGEEQPSPKALREAVRDVIRHCIYGVDLNPMAVELCKVALWLESHNPNAPLGFLDHHIKCGNAIVGLAHADELERGIPDEAFKRLPDDDKDVCARLRKNNKAQRKDRETGQQVNYGERLGRDLRKVLDALTEVDAMPERTPEEVSAKQAAYDKWKKNIDRRSLKIVADLQVAQFFIPKTLDMERRVITDETYFRHLKGELQLVGPAVAEAMAVANKRENRFFHWFLEFPEIFAAGGFDCILGNPPFLGGGSISTALGVRPHLCLKEYFMDSCGIATVRGQIDLVAYFFRRGYQLLAPQMVFLAFIGTNSIGQGDTRAGGLAHIVAKGGNICLAKRSIRWPGTANVIVSLVGIEKGGKTASAVLDGSNVEFINPSLTDADELGDPHPLEANAERSFEGSKVYGSGFVLEDTQAQLLIAADPRSEDVIRPYLSGVDVTRHPLQKPGRWVIDFADRTLEQASEFEACYEHLVRHVKPERNSLPPSNAWNKQVRALWWRFGARRPHLYEAVAGLSRVLVQTRVTKTHAVAFVPSDIVFADSLTVFAYADSATFALLQSSLHEHWAWAWGSTLKSDRRYTPARCFQTFPFPLRASRPHNALSPLAEQYLEIRRGLAEQLEIGLTTIYSLFHTRNLTPADVTKASKADAPDSETALAAVLALRQRHIEMDNAVLAAYGWDGEVDLAHAFYEVDYLPENDNIRFTISPTARRDILQRLLKLNHERHAEEVAAGLHEKKTAKKVARQPAPTVQPTRSSSGVPDISIPGQLRLPSNDVTTYLMQFVLLAIEQAGGTVRLMDLARAYVLLKHRNIVTSLASGTEIENAVSTWSTGFSEEISESAFSPTIKQMALSRREVALEGTGRDVMISATVFASMPPDPTGWRSVDAQIACWAVARLEPAVFDRADLTKAIERMMAELAA